MARYSDEVTEVKVGDVAECMSSCLIGAQRGLHYTVTEVCDWPSLSTAQLIRLDEFPGKTYGASMFKLIRRAPAHEQEQPMSGELNHGEPLEFEWTRKRHDIRQAAKRFLEGDEAMSDPAVSEGEKPQRFTIVRLVSRDRIASSKDDILAHYRKDAREQVAVKVFENLPNDEAVMLAVREMMEPDEVTRSVVVRIVADVTPVPNAIATMQKLKAENAALRQQLNYEAHAAHLAKLDTSGLADRIAEVAYPSIPGIVPSDGWMFARESVRQNVEAALAPLLEQRKKDAECIAKLDAMLKKVDKRVSHFHGCPARYANRCTCDCGATQIEDDIDTILKEQHNED